MSYMVYPPPPSPKLANLVQIPSFTNTNKMTWGSIIMNFIANQWTWCLAIDLDLTQLEIILGNIAYLVSHIHHIHIHQTISLWFSKIFFLDVDDFCSIFTDNLLPNLEHLFPGQEDLLEITAPTADFINPNKTNPAE